MNVFGFNTVAPNFHKYSPALVALTVAGDGKFVAFKVYTPSFKIFVSDPNAGFGWATTLIAFEFNEIHPLASRAVAVYVPLVLTSAKILPSNFVLQITSFVVVATKLTELIVPFSDLTQKNGEAPFAVAMVGAAGNGRTVIVTGAEANE